MVYWQTGTATRHRFASGQRFRVIACLVQQSALPQLGRHQVDQAPQVRRPHRRRDVEAVDVRLLAPALEIVDDSGGEPTITEPRPPIATNSARSRTVHVRPLERVVNDAGGELIRVPSGWHASLIGLRSTKEEHQDAVGRRLVNVAGARKSVRAALFSDLGGMVPVLVPVAERILRLQGGDEVPLAGVRVQLATARWRACLGTAISGDG